MSSLVDEDIIEYGFPAFAPKNFIGLVDFDMLSDLLGF